MVSHNPDVVTLNNFNAETATATFLDDAVNGVYRKDMGVRIFQYRILPDKVQDYLAVQKKADAIYSKHLNYRIEHLQNDRDPAEWIEIHWYGSEAEREKAEHLSKQEPQLKSLFDQFLRCLDPANTHIDERDYSMRAIH